MARPPQEQVTHFVSDMYSVEEQALVQMQKAPDLAGDPGLADDFRKHEVETAQHVELMRHRLEALGGSTSKIKDAVMKLGGQGFVLFARALPETPGRLVCHAYSYEAMEWAGYAMLLGMAERAGDAETVDAARAVQDQEQAMLHRLADRFDAVEAVVHRDVPREEMADHVRKHLAEAHALESQAQSLLGRSETISCGQELEALYEQHHDAAREHAGRLEDRLEAVGGKRSLTEDAALALGGLDWSVFFQVQSDTPAKLAAFVYAFEHLQIAGYELLQRTAGRAGDAQTQQLCRELLAAKRDMTTRLAAAFDTAVDRTLATV